MICVIPFHPGDVSLAQELLRWIEDLGGCKNHDALLVVDRATQWSLAVDVLGQAQKSFRQVNIAVPDVAYDFGWPQGPNAMFKFAAKYVEENLADHWLWLEPDASPLQPGWMDALDNAYKGCGRRFMGAVYRSNNPEIPLPCLSGVAVYPNDCLKEAIEATKGTGAFDVVLSQKLDGAVAHTDLIHWFWGEKREVSPRFAEINVPGTEVFCLKQLKKEAVLFHRCKDGSLIRLLRDQLFPKSDNFVVAYPFFPMDAALALKNIRWMRELRQPRTHEIRLFYESTTQRQIVNEIAEAASPIFSAVKHSPYKPVSGPNSAWKVVAYEMQRVKRSWLWMEPDAIPLRQDWLMTLQTKYSHCRKPFFGPIVPDMKHMNGTAIYPWNTPELCPRTFASGDPYGFDVLMSGEVSSLIHDASDVFHHTWVERGGQLKPHGEGDYPTFPNIESLRRLKKGSVLFHRNKDGTLIDRLREAQKS
jgi:hypothetical protein